MICDVTQGIPDILYSNIRFRWLFSAIQSKTVMIFDVTRGIPRYPIFADCYII